MNKFLFALFFSSVTAFAQQTDVVDFLRIEALIRPDVVEKKIAGRFVATFEVLKETDSIFMDAVNIKIDEIKSKVFKISADEKKIWFVGKFEKEKTYVADFYYEMKPKQTLYFFGDEIWTQGQGKYTSHWLPSIDDVNDKIEFDLVLFAQADNAIIANGKLMDLGEIPEARHFDMKNPMSSYLVAFAIGDFNKKELVSNSGIPIELYYKPQDSLKVEPTYRYSKQIFDFLEREIGVAYPWQNYKQVPLRDFLYAGMENTTATFFSEAFVVDSIGFNDRNYVNVNAHELAHQWFGDMVTETANEDHWLQEGFATYYALLAERDIFGEDYYYWQLYQSAEQLKAMSDEGKGESLLNPKASSLTFYQKGAWALHILRERIGDEAFKTAIKNYLEKYKFKNVSTDDFLNEVKAVSQTDISDFEKDWLQQAAFKAEEAYQSLLKSSFIKKYFENAALRATPLADKKIQLKAALTFPNDFIGQEAVYQLAEEPLSETLPLYKIAFESNNLYVRQAVALSLQTIPKELQSEYENLLNDASYVTIETALYQLWMQFPEKRTEYLNKTKGIEGFQNKNIRQLWLALALLTDNYEMSEKENYLKELKNYTSTDYSFEIREKAFEYVNELQLWDLETLKNLVEATVHPTWRFAKSSKALMNSLLQNEKYHEQLRVLGRQVSEKAANYLNSTIKE
ncbi:MULTISPECIES: M1 family metallopeptidase [Aequorivita]|uniref:Aminopeptidase N n=1 Tax=Aequorivita iocasae TaxID=2803865 RepID=A0ABX7DT51_9FLAO|nr:MULTISPECIES: M1 family metallopeptidase [Aequorivita]QQX76733.1 M1 family metallopeptidase [Aequorivita iocasae]UCA56205.1 M1 family metallopeptidase [Aequorivita sp. F7]